MLGYGDVEELIAYPKSWIAGGIHVSPGSPTERPSCAGASPGAAPSAPQRLGPLIPAPSGRAGEAGALSGVFMRLTSWWLGFGGRMGAFLSIMGVNKQVERRAVTVH